MEDDECYFDDEEDERGNTLNRLLGEQTGNEFVRNADGEIK